VLCFFPRRQNGSIPTPGTRGLSVVIDFCVLDFFARDILVNLLFAILTYFFVSLPLWRGRCKEIMCGFLKSCFYFACFLPASMCTVVVCALEKKAFAAFRLFDSPAVVLVGVLLHGVLCSRVEVNLSSIDLELSV